ncbi:MAG TPA: hypothetical protein VN041_12130 [Microbacterium sp.]|nr:hypothetical protein [Microbacterium sp.]
MTDPTRRARRDALIAAGAIPVDEIEATEEQFAYAVATPNVVVQNPTVRRIAGIVLGVASLLTSAAIVIDGSSPAFDISAITTPAGALVLFLAGAFQVGVTTPNVPRS